MKRFFALVFCLAAILLAGCQKEPSLTISGPASLELGVDGGSQTLTFTANRDWTVSSSDSWVSVSPSSGKASDKPVSVTVRCNANTTYDDRSATVTIRMEGLTQSVTVRQPANLGLILPSKSYDIPADARSVEVEVQANVQYTVSVSADWIKQTGSKGLTSTKLTFSVEENTTYDARSATITIKPQAAGVPEQVVSVKQAQKDALIVGNTSYDMPYGGGEIEVKVDANVSFEVKSGADWIQHLDTKALSSSTVRLKVEENPTFASREGKVEISQKGGGLSYTLTVKQAGRVAVTEVTLNSTALSLVEGEATVLTATVKPDNATDKSVAWSSDKPEVAAVDGAGRVTAIAGGTAKITATAGGKSATCTVTVETRTIKVGDKMEVPAEGGTFEIDIEYNTDFTVEVEQAAQSWITFIQTKAMTSGKLQFSFAANEGTEPRSGKVTVRDKSGKAAPVTMTFTQAERKVLKIGDVTEIPAGGGTFEVDIEYNTDFTVEVEQAAQSWITFIQTKAMTSGKLQFSFAANESVDPRSGKVTVRDKSGKAAPVTLTFTQEGAEAILNVGDKAIEVPEEGGTLEVDIEYNTDFKVEVDPDAESWLSFVQTKALSNGKMQFQVAPNDVDDIRTGYVDIVSKSGYAVVKLSFRQASKLRRQLMAFYNALDGPNWTKNAGWGTDAPLTQWEGIYYDFGVNKYGIHTSANGLKGEIPEMVGDFGESLSTFFLFDEPGITGTLPGSFAKLTGLKRFGLFNTSMTSLPDVFSGMTLLENVDVAQNEKMGGNLPASLGASPKLKTLEVVCNALTGELPASWARLGTGLRLEDNCLSGGIPRSYVDSEYAEYFFTHDRLLLQKKGYGFDISDIDLYGWFSWPEGKVEDLDGKQFSFPEVIAGNKYTVYIFWATWCPFSKVLMPQLRDYYELYHKDGLEVIATIAAGDSDGNPPTAEGQRKEVSEKGYGKWVNYFFWQQTPEIYPMQVPVAEVYDSEGKILFSSISNYPDPVRRRFGKTASTDLIPFLETLLGPADKSEPHTSTDNSRDGEVLTLQKAEVAKGINIVFMGDAYTDKDMGDGGLYETVMNQAMEQFFAIEPYKTFRNRFNVYAVKAVSLNDRIGDGYSTAFSSYFGSGTMVGGDEETCYAYAKKVPGITDDNLLICVMVNSPQGRGTTYMSASKQSSVAFTTTLGNDASAFGSTLRHEAGGHGFGFLADEYSSSYEAAPADHIAEYNDAYEKYGWFSNVDFTNDPSKIRWSAFLSDARYKDEVGIFEGGALYSKGAWRPSQNSMMRDNFEYFNAPSRWAIYQRIMKLTGEECTFAKFLEYDAVNRGKSQAAVRPPLKLSERREPGAPPVIVR